MKNKRGQITFLLFFLVIIALITMIVLGLSSWTFGIIDDELREINFELGDTSWDETYNQTTGRALEAASTTAPQIISIGLLIGMILVMMFIGYHAEVKNKLWIMLDIGIIIVVEIFAGMTVTSFYGIMNITPELLDVYSNTLSAGSKFIINLPIIIPIVGVLIMIITNIVNKLKRKEEVVRF